MKATKEKLKKELERLPTGESYCIFLDEVIDLLAEWQINFTVERFGDLNLIACYRDERIVAVRFPRNIAGLTSDICVDATICGYNKHCETNDTDLALYMIRRCCGGL